jgi:hypothetical protein
MSTHVGPEMGKRSVGGSRRQKNRWQRLKRRENNRREMFRRRFPNVAFHGDASPEEAKTGIQWLPFWESKRKF